jgi:hypothetical protein
MVPLRRVAPGKSWTYQLASLIVARSIGHLHARRGYRGLSDIEPFVHIAQGAPQGVAPTALAIAIRIRERHAHGALHRRVCRPPSDCGERRATRFLALRMTQFPAAAAFVQRMVRSLL